MKAKTIFAILIVISMLITSLSFAADDGPLFTRNISRTPEHDDRGVADEQHVAVRARPEHPGRAAGDGSGEIEYLVGDCTSRTPRLRDRLHQAEAKPLIVTYNDGVGRGGPGHRRRIRQTGRLCRAVAGRRRHLEERQPVRLGPALVVHCSRTATPTPATSLR